MIAVDTNVLVAAHRVDAPFHASGRQVLRELVSGDSPWCVPWTCLHEFFRVVTGKGIFPKPSPVDAALQFMRELLACDSLVMIGEGPAHYFELERLIREGKVTGALVHDARIAAICLAHGVRELLTADRDFLRFPELKTRNPLVPLP